ncbi:dienelactone hydrolase family protein [Rhodosalinus sediminis]|uniref:dienelactone hydrolase family protein n=1 Tax=Rhodosalinus sediminis TaxID=1940533 RepID=UPI002356BBB6|nr:dienelactone hydrolase family protein [Rhodosalinus sediminis]
MRCTLIAATTAAALAAPAAQAQVEGVYVDYTLGDTVFEGYYARNAALDEVRGTVVIVHDWDGMTAYEERRAEMLAARGYAAFALDVYGKEADPQGVDDYRALSGAMYGDRETFRARLRAGVEAARAQEGAPEAVVVMGYCFGGAGTLELARAGADVEGFVSFHGGLGTPEGQSYAGQDAPVLLLHGSADPVSGMGELAALLDALQAAEVPHAARVFGGARHSFTVWGSDDYDLAADRASWDALEDFLSDRF